MKPPKDDKNKHQHELIGPPSSYIDLKAFLNDIKLNWSLCTGTDERLIYEPFTHLDAASREAIQTRVSVDDLKQECQPHFLDDGVLADLKLWQWARAYCGSDDPVKLNHAILQAGTAAKSRKLGANAHDTGLTPAHGRRKKAAAADDDEAGEDEILIDPALDTPDGGSPEASTSALVEPATGKKTKKAMRKKRDPPQSVVEPGLGSSIEAVMTKMTESSLRSQQPIYGYHYLRRTRQSDYQSLSHLRTTYIPAFSQYATSDEALDHYKTTTLATEILVYVTVHPIPNKVTATGIVRESVTIPARLQKIVFLASQTLADLRDAIVSAPNAVPDQRNEADDLQERLGEAPMTESTRGIKRFYMPRKWKTGAVCAISGKLYPDTRDSKQENYAELLLDLLSADYSETTFRRGRTNLENPEILLQEYNDEIDPTLMASTSNGGGRAQPYSPDYALSGKSMQETTLMDLVDGMRLGEPNLLWQQGCDERVFVFEEIRLLHHTDPAPVLPTLTPEVSPYPISTFLSRLNVNKCAICEKDPATRVTINDELAGVTPCHMCDACFEHLHGTDEAALAAGVSIVPVLEELS